ncbi:family 61 glycoside hydrolase [Aureobasidium subglaciale]|nr:family 61 glycoside hydrolase [Aureobasidium subglaciale]
MRSFATIMAAAALAQTAMAHYRFNQLIVGDEVTKEYEYVRQNSNMNSPVTDVTSKDLVCNVGGLDTGAQTKTYKVAPGDTVGFAVDTPIQHPGPLNVYMSKATGEASEYDGSGDWFKIYELGADKVGDNGLTFKADKLDKVTFTLPDETPAGQYLLRVEHIGLHSASSFGGAQFYISCAQIEVSGSSTAKPDPTVKIPGVYTGHEDSIELSIYYPIPKNYQPPGPAVWGDGTAGSDNSSAPATSVAASSAAATSVAPVTTSISTQETVATDAPYTSDNATSAAAGPTGFSTVIVSSTAPITTGTTGGAVKKYMQCGGKAYSGATECESGSTCKVQNEYYSQCI